MRFENYHQMNIILKNSCLCILLLTKMTVLSQKNLGLLKKEKITTYWDKEEKIIRSSGYYKVDGVTSVGAKTGKWKYYYRNGNN